MFCVFVYDATLLYLRDFRMIKSSRCTGNFGSSWKEGVVTVAASRFNYFYVCNCMSIFFLMLVNIH